MNLPGFKKEDVTGEVKDGYLIIKASTKNSKDEKDAKGKYIRKERYEGSCNRSFYVGDAITQDDIKAKFDDAEFIEFDDYPIREVAQIKSKYLPEHSYRTYHPGYGNRYSEWYHKVFESIVERINSNK